MLELETFEQTELEAFLAHYGKKGMKWGVVHEEPSGGSESGGASQLSKLKAHNLKVNTNYQATIKARLAKNQLRVADLNREIAGIERGKFSLKARYQRDNLKAEALGLQGQIDKDAKTAAKTPTTGMTPTQKKVLIGASVAAAVGVAAIAYYNRDEIAGAIRLGANKRNYGDIFKRNEALAKAGTPDEVFGSVVKGANPAYNTLGGQMNCRRVTFAYEMRRRGYDVSATTSAVGRGQNETGLVNALIKGDRNRKSIASMSSFVQKSLDPVESIRTRAVANDSRMYKATTDALHFNKKLNTRFTPVVDPAETASKIAKSLSSQPTGARGEIAFNMNRFVHSMQYEIFDGVPHIFDSQKAAHYPVTEEGLKALTKKWGDPAGAAITRLDNLELDTNFLSQWVK